MDERSLTVPCGVILTWYARGCLAWVSAFGRGFTKVDEIECPPAGSHLSGTAELDPRRLLHVLVNVSYAVVPLAHHLLEHGVPDRRLLRRCECEPPRGAF